LISRLFCDSWVKILDNRNSSDILIMSDDNVIEVKIVDPSFDSSLSRRYKGGSAWLQAGFINDAQTTVVLHKNHAC
jgi:hypothetical protein